MSCRYQATRLRVTVSQMVVQLMWLSIPWSNIHSLEFLWKPEQNVINLSPTQTLKDTLKVFQLKGSARTSVKIKDYNPKVGLIITFLTSNTETCFFITFIAVRVCVCVCFWVCLSSHTFYRFFQRFLSSDDDCRWAFLWPSTLWNRFSSWNGQHTNPLFQGPSCWNWPTVNPSTSQSTTTGGNREQRACLFTRAWMCTSSLFPDHHLAASRRPVILPQTWYLRAILHFCAAGLVLTNQTNQRPARTRHKARVSVLL